MQLNSNLVHLVSDRETGGDIQGHSDSWRNVQHKVCGLDRDQQWEGGMHRIPPIKKTKAFSCASRNPPKEKHNLLCSEHLGWRSGRSSYEQVVVTSVCQLTALKNDARDVCPWGVFVLSLLFSLLFLSFHPRIAHRTLPHSSSFLASCASCCLSFRSVTYTIQATSQLCFDTDPVNRAISNNEKVHAVGSHRLA